MKKIILDDGQTATLQDKDKPILIQKLNAELKSHPNAKSVYIGIKDIKTGKIVANDFVSSNPDYTVFTKVNELSKFKTPALVKLLNA